MKEIPKEIPTPITLPEHIMLALLNGATQIRMPVGPPIQMRENEELDEAFTWFAPELPPEVKAEEGLYYRTNNGLIFHAHSLIGAPGDVIGVREDWMELPKAYWADLSLSKNALLTIDGYHGANGYAYKLSTTKEGESARQCLGLSWHPADTMPDEAIRLKYRIESVKVERVQEISFKDCLASGVNVGDWIESDQMDKHYPPNTQNLTQDEMLDASYDAYAKSLFENMWNANNPAHPWEANCWTWKYEVVKI